MLEVFCAKHREHISEEGGEMRTDRNEIRIAGSDLIVTPRGLDVLWCFRRQLSIHCAAVKSVRVAPKSTLQRGIRALGTDIGVKICGTFHSAGNTNFWNYRSPGPVLVIELRLQQQYTNLYLSVADPEKTCVQLNNQLRLVPQ